MISIIAAMGAANHIIGDNNKLPWRLANDMKHFRELTTGKSVIMGRKTYESIGKPLRNRRNIVISSNPDLRLEGCAVVGSLSEAIKLANDAPEIMIIGGASVYRQALPLADRLYLTFVYGPIRGDAYFPFVDPKEWEPGEFDTQGHYPDADNSHFHVFRTFTRKK